MNKLTTIIISIVGIYFSSSAFAIESHSVYLVRHAEKEQNQKNPSLTSCGQVRAYQLATLLENADIKEVYSTSTLRTMATANPIASQQKLIIKNYTADKLMSLALELRESGKNLLVVGHSNTTPQLIEVLTGEVVEPMEEKEYQKLYQIRFVDGVTFLTKLKQPLECH